MNLFSFQLKLSNSFFVLCSISSLNLVHLIFAMLLVDVVCTAEPTFSFQKGSESQLLFSHCEGVLQVLNGAGLVQFVILDQVRSETATRPH